ncbi:hypothetical protein K9L05_02850, partial [Candidatus Babeliales bacterium]|nr:hypothetical protein [Candidatus Babeliales bacterium]
MKIKNFFSKFFILISAFQAIFFCNLFTLEQEIRLSDFTKIIGRGGYGEIYASDQDGKENIVLKVSRNTRQCQNYKLEFDNQLQIYEKYKSFEHPQGFEDRATFLRPFAYQETEEDGKYCFYAMERLYPLTGTLLYQIYLGEKSWDQKFGDEHFVRGHYLGYNQIEKIVNEFQRLSPDRSNFELLCYDLGRLIAIMHLGAEFDGKDTEYVLAKRSKDEVGNWKLVVIDFDMTRSIHNLFEERNIEEIAQA